MKRSYGILLVAILGVAVALTVAGRLRLGSRAPRVEAPAARAPWVAVRIEVKDGAIEPPTTSVPKDHEVRLTVINHGAKIALVALSGYEDKIKIPPLAPRDHWSGAFLADRPGEDFAWLLNGEPAGRLAVTGAHLMDGHQ